MTPLISSFVVVALADMDDKTPLIALTSGVRYCRFREFSIACERDFAFGPKCGSQLSTTAGTDRSAFRAAQDKRPNTTTFLCRSGICVPSG